MDHTSSRITAMRTQALGAIKLACLPAALLLASCNAPPPPAATTTVIERQPIVEHPALTVEVPVAVGHDDDQRRHDDDQKRRDDDQRRRDQQNHDGPH